MKTTTIQSLQLSDCITLAKGKPPAELPYYGIGALPYLSPEYLRGNAQPQLAKATFNSVTVKDGDTILLWDGSNAGEFFRGRNGLLASTMSLVGHDAVFEPDYFYYSVKRLEPYLKGQTSGSGIPHVDKEVLGKLEILQLPRNEQNQIAKILSKLDQAIEQTEAIIAKQQRIKAGLMQDLLTKGIDENGNIRSEATHEFKNSPLGRIPVEWKEEKLGAISSFVTSGSRGWAKYYSNEGALFIRIGNLTRNHINLRLEDLVFVQVPETSEGKRTAVSEGDLLISITADLGIIGVIPKEFPEAYINQHIALVRMNLEAVVPRFIGHLLNGVIGQSQIEKLNESGAKAGLNLPTIENLLILLPDKTEQNHIAEILDSTDKQIAHQKRQLNKLNHEKRGLMHDLLSGKVRVNKLLESQIG